MLIVVPSFLMAARLSHISRQGALYMPARATCKRLLWVGANFTRFSWQGCASWSLLDRTRSTDHHATTGSSRVVGGGGMRSRRMEWESEQAIRSTPKRSRWAVAVGCAALLIAVCTILVCGALVTTYLSRPREPNGPLRSHAMSLHSTNPCESRPHEAGMYLATAALLDESGKAAPARDLAVA